MQVFDFSLSPHNTKRKARGRIYSARIETGLLGHEYFAQPIFIAFLPTDTPYRVECGALGSDPAAKVDIVFDAPVQRGKFFSVSLRMLAVPGPSISPAKITPI